MDELNDAALQASVMLGGSVKVGRTFCLALCATVAVVVVPFLPEERMYFQVLENSCGFPAC